MKQAITSKYETVAAFSGGANRGAELLGYMQNMNFKYDAIVTNSVTSLMALHIKSKKFDDAETVFRMVEHRDVFSRSPFLKSGKLNPWSLISLGLSIFWHDVLGFGKSGSGLSLGDSRSLREFLNDVIPRELFDYCKFSPGDVIITTYNQTTHQKVYTSIKDVDFEEFKDLQWHSANAPLVMTHEEYRGNLMTDGGVAEMVPASKAVQLASKRVECYICRSFDEVWGPKRKEVNNFFDNVGNIVQALTLETIQADLQVARETAKLKGIEFCEYYLCDKQSHPVYLFHPEIIDDLLDKAGHRKLKTQRIN